MNNDFHMLLNYCHEEINKAFAKKYIFLTTAKSSNLSSTLKIVYFTHSFKAPLAL